VHAGARDTNPAPIRGAVRRRLRESEPSKPSGIAAKKTMLKVHLIPQFGDKLTFVAPSAS